MRHSLRSNATFRPYNSLFHVVRCILTEEALYGYTINSTDACC